MSQFLRALAAWREPKHGIVSTRKSPPDHSVDNGLLFNACMLLILKEQPDATGEELVQEVLKFRALVEACSAEPGLLARYPVDWGQGQEQQHDDYRGVIAASAVFGLPFAREILEYGRRNDFCWNLKDPGRFEIAYDFDRLPGFTAMAMLAAGESVPSSEQLSFLTSCAGILRESKTETTGTILQWLGCKTMHRAGWAPALGCLFWRSRAMRKWPGGMAQVWGVYFPPGPDGEPHPFSVFARRDFL